MSEPTSARYIIESSAGTVYCYDIKAIRDAYRRDQVASTDLVHDTETNVSKPVSAFLVPVGRLRFVDQSREQELPGVVISGSQLTFLNWVLIGFGFGVGFVLAGLFMTFVIGLLATILSLL